MALFVKVSGQDLADLPATSGYDDSHNGTHSTSQRAWQVRLPIRGFGDLLQNRISFVKECPHVAAEENDLCQPSQNRQRGGKTENVFHLGLAGGQRSKEVIVPHESEGALNHRVLKVDRWLHRGDFTGEVLPDTEVLSSPGNAL
jgi:hypothetical protein